MFVMDVLLEKGVAYKNTNTSPCPLKGVMKKNYMNLDKD